MSNSYKKYAQLRDEKGLTDYAVSQKTGISRATMSCWKNGVYEPKAEKIKKIAELFDKPLGYFFEE